MRRKQERRTPGRRRRGRRKLAPRWPLWNGLPAPPATVLPEPPPPPKEAILRQPDTRKEQCQSFTFDEYYFGGTFMVVVVTVFAGMRYGAALWLPGPRWAFIYH